MPVRPRRPLGSGLRPSVVLAVAAAAVVPHPAAAADAPLRTIAVDADGRPTTDLRPAAISSDGRYVTGTIGYNRPVVRDVVAGTTSRLLAPTLSGQVVGASNDGNRVLIRSDAAVLPVDTDGGDGDLYLVDRRAGTVSFVSGSPTTGKLGVGGTHVDVDDAVISGDGNTVLFSARHTFFTSTDAYYGTDAWRYDVGAARLRKTGDEPETCDVTCGSQSDTDDAGTVQVGASGIHVGSRTIPFPAPVAADGGNYEVRVSPDGGSLALRPANGRATAYLISAATGATTKVTIPAWAQGTGWSLLQALNGGAGAVVGTTVNRGAGPRYAIGLLDRTGAITTQFGGDVKLADGQAVTALSPNRQFAATNLHLAQLGTLPLPGTEPVLPATAQAFDYVDFTDVHCTSGLFGKTWYRAALFLAGAPRGTDPRTPSKADVTVFDTATRKTINAFTLAAGKARDLTVGRTGGFTLTATVTFTDGSSLAGVRPVPTHEPDPCPLVL